MNLSVFLLAANLIVPNAQDARFVDSSKADLSLNDYKPRASWSAVVDKGTDQPWMTGATDLAGTNRVMGTAVDFGAYESDGTEPQPVYEPVDLATAVVTFSPPSATYDGQKHEPTVTVTTNGCVVTDGYLSEWDDDTLTAAKTYTLTLTDDGSGIFKSGTSKTATFTISAYRQDGIWVAADGSDTTGDGSYDAPYATITKALTDATAGGIIYVKAGTITENAQISVTKSVTIAGDPAASRESVILSGNNAHRVFLVNGANVTLSGLTVTNGLHDVGDFYGGGGASCQGGGTLVVTNCVFAGNRATTTANSVFVAHGGAISCLMGNSTATQYDCVGTVRVYDSVFVDNAATRCAGAIDGATEIVGCTFRGNNVLQSSAAASVGSSTLYLRNAATVQNCLFAGNGTYSGGTANTASYNLIGLGPEATLIENCTFVHNGSRSGTYKSCLIFSHKSHAYSDWGTPSTSANLLIRNCLFNDNTVGTSLVTTLFEAIGKVALPAIAPDGAENTASCNNIVAKTAADAQFKDAAGGDYTPLATWGTVVDAGANQTWMNAAKDLAGRERILNGTVDIGAYECPNVALKPVVYVATDGDDTTGTGTESKPFLTLAKALTRVETNGTVYVKAGIYAMSATAVVPMAVTISGAPNTTREAVVLDGQNTCRLLSTDYALTLQNLTVTRGYLNAYGGAGLYGTSTSTLVVSNCVFSACDTKDYKNAGLGAAICARGTLALYDSRIAANTMNTRGAVACEGTTLVCRRCDFVDNYCYGVGGALSKENAGASTVDHCRFVNNRCYKTTSWIDGDAIYCNGGQMTIANTLFASNGVYSANAYQSYNLISLAGKGHVIENCTFVRNGARGGDADRSWLIKTSQSTGALTLRNCLFNDNAIGAGLVNDLTGEADRTFVCPSSGTTAQGCRVVETAAAAQFADAAHGDYTPLNTWRTVVDRGATASVISAKDLAGNPRIFNGRIDIGAYECPSALLMPIVYVSTEGSDDEGLGTEDNPYASLAVAINYVEPNGTVYIAAGTYPMAEQINIGRSVTISGAEGTVREEVVLKSADTGDGTRANRQLSTTSGTTRLVGLTLDGDNLPFAGNGGLWYVNPGCDSTATNCIFRNSRCENGNDKAWRGSAVLTHGDLDMIDCLVGSNMWTQASGTSSSYTTWIGGAVATGDNENGDDCLMLRNCAFVGNRSICNGHAVFVTERNQPARGRQHTIVNCLFMDNGDGSASANGVITVNFGGKTATAASLLVENATFKDNALATSQMVIYNCGSKGTVTVRNGLFAGNTAGGTALATKIACLGETITAQESDNVYVAAADAQFQADGLTPMGTWAAVVNQGATATSASAVDLAGNARVYNNVIDIGAYEYVGKTYYKGEDPSNPERAPVAYDDQWLADAGVVTAGKTAAEVQTQLDTSNANGITKADAYALGYAPNEVSTAALVLQPQQTADTNSVHMTIAGLPTGSYRAGATVAYEAHYSDTREMTEYEVIGEVDPAGFNFELPDSGVRYYRVRAVITMPK